MNRNKGECTLCELRKLEVINVCDGTRLGCISDVIFDLCSGCIQSILVPKKYEITELFCKRDKRFTRIPWCCIERIGDDIILVRLEQGK